MDKEVYDEMHILGRGAHADCRLALRRSDNRLVVIKKFSLTMNELEEKARSDAIQEIDILSSLSHDNIVKFLDTYVNDDRLNIVMEYADGGNIYDYLKGRKEMLDEGEVWEIFVQLVDALNYLHNEKLVIHRDLKTQNILLNGSGKREVKVADFGIAMHYKEGMCTTNQAS